MTIIIIKNKEDVVNFKDEYTSYTSMVEYLWYG